MDYIEYYSDDVVKAWYEEFQKEENKDRLFIKGIPFGFLTVRLDHLRRIRIKGILDDLSQQKEKP